MRNGTTDTNAGSGGCHREAISRARAVLGEVIRSTPANEGTYSTPREHHGSLNLMICGCRSAITIDPNGDLLEIALDGLDHLIHRPREIYVEDGPGLTAVVIVDHFAAR
jgi:hypothetical protein